jgi:hypothetical protein
MQFIEVMWRTRLTTAVLILAWLATPEILCLLPGVEMTADEQECCEQMGSDCGKVPMTDMQNGHSRFGWNGQFPHSCLGGYPGDLYLAATKGHGGFG